MIYNFLAIKDPAYYFKKGIEASYHRDIPEEIKNFKKAIQYCLRDIGKHKDLLLASYDGLATAYMHKEDYEKAEATFLESLKYATSFYGEESMPTAQIYGLLGLYAKYESEKELRESKIYGSRGLRAKDESEKALRKSKKYSGIALEIKNKLQGKNASLDSSIAGGTSTGDLGRIDASTSEKKDFEQELIMICAERNFDGIHLYKYDLSRNKRCLIEKYAVGKICFPTRIRVYEDAGVYVYPMANILYFRSIENDKIQRTVEITDKNYQITNFCLDNDFLLIELYTETLKRMVICVKQKVGYEARIEISNPYDYAAHFDGIYGEDVSLLNQNGDVKDNLFLIGTIFASLDGKLKKVNYYEESINHDLNFVDYQERNGLLLSSSNPSDKEDEIIQLHYGKKKILPVRGKFAFWGYDNCLLFFDEKSVLSVMNVKNNKIEKLFDDSWGYVVGSSSYPFVFSKTMDNRFVALCYGFRGRDKKYTSGLLVFDTMKIGDTYDCKTYDGTPRHWTFAIARKKGKEKVP